MTSTGRAACAVTAAFLCTIALVLLPPAASAAQVPKPRTSQTQGPAAARPAAESDALGRSTPRGAVLGFLNAARRGDFGGAAQYLNTDLRGEAASRLAEQLFVVLDTRLPARLGELSEHPEGTNTNGLPSGQNLVGVIPRADRNLDVIVERANRGKNGWIWLFSRATLGDVPDVYAEVRPVSTATPALDFLVNTRVAGLRLYDWIALVLCGPLFYLMLVVLKRVIRPIAQAITSRLTPSSRPQPDVLPRPLRLLLASVAISWMASFIRLPLLARQLWSVTSTLITAVALIWWTISLNHKGEQYVVRRFPIGQANVGISLVHLGRWALDISIVVAGVFLTLRSIGVNLTPVLAGLGVGGIAVALAAQKTLENIVAGISLIFDKAVRVGDTLKVTDAIQGTVDYIGLRSTRIRTLDRTIVSVPNAQIASMTLEALSARDKFWFHPLLPLNCATSAEQLRQVLDGVRGRLEGHEAVFRESIRVRLVRLGPLSFDVDVFAYIGACNWNEFLGVQEQLLFDILDIVQRARTSIAFTTPSTLLATPSAERADASRASQAQLSASRQS